MRYVFDSGNAWLTTSLRCRALAQIRAEGFFHHDARPAAVRARLR